MNTNIAKRSDFSLTLEGQGSIRWCQIFGRVCVVFFNTLLICIQIFTITTLCHCEYVYVHVRFEITCVLKVFSRIILDLTLSYKVKRLRNNYHVHYSMKHSQYLFSEKMNCGFQLTYRRIAQEFCFFSKNNFTICILKDALECDMTK